jgi:hypothetical protein
LVEASVGATAVVFFVRGLDPVRLTFDLAICLKI